MVAHNQGRWRYASFGLQRGCPLFIGLTPRHLRFRVGGNIWWHGQRGYPLNLRPKAVLVQAFSWRLRHFANSFPKANINLGVCVHGTAKSCTHGLATTVACLSRSYRSGSHVCTVSDSEFRVKTKRVLRSITQNVIFQTAVLNQFGKYLRTWFVEGPHLKYTNSGKYQRLGHACWS